MIKIFGYQYINQIYKNFNWVELILFWCNLVSV